MTQDSKPDALDVARVVELAIEQEAQKLAQAYGVSTEAVLFARTIVRVDADDESERWSVSAFGLDWIDDDKEAIESAARVALIATCKKLDEFAKQASIALAAQVERVERERDALRAELLYVAQKITPLPNGFFLSFRTFNEHLAQPLEDSLREPQPPHGEGG